MDEAFDFVRGVFGPDQLQVVAAELVAPLRISERSKQFLLTVGLPREATIYGVNLGFNLLNRLPTLRQLLPEHADRLDPAWDECPFLSMAYGCGFYLNQPDGGEIWTAAMDSADTEFVNSSVEMLGWFLAAYRRLELDYDPHAPRLAAVLAVEGRTRAMDPPAMAGDAPYWPVIMEDLKL